MTTIRQLKKDKRAAIREEEEIKERLSEITKRRKVLEKQIQDQCKHTKYHITESGHYDTLGCSSGSTFYKWCDGCGIKLDEKYVGDYTSKYELRRRFGW